MGRMLNRFFKDEQGATAIEYSLIAAMIAIPIIAILQSIGVELKQPFQDVETGLKKRG